jgi:hypothetical protein
MIPFQVDPGWYDRHWYANDVSDRDRSFLPGWAFRLLIGRARAVRASLRVGDFKLWHSPLGPDQLRN